MQITTEITGDLMELRCAGRLDAEWSNILWKSIDDALRQGFHAVVVDLSGVTFISSTGLTVLIRAHQQFQAIRGFFGVYNAVGPVEDVFRLSGLAKMLLCDPAAIRKAAAGIHSTIQLAPQIVSTPLADFEMYDVDKSARATCEVFGDPSRLASGTYAESDCAVASFGRDSCGLGLGSLGESFTEAVPRFGELLVAAGAVAQLPAGSSGSPDFQSARGEFIPQARLLYGLRWTGPFARLLRFDAPAADRCVPLAALLDQCLKLCNAPAAALVIAAETAGLVGASLRRSPAAASAGDSSRFEHPAIRDWLSFTPERVFPHTLALVVAVAARAPLSPDVARLEPFLRPMSRDGQLLAHAHAAVFPFRPFKKRMLDFAATVGTLFDSEQLQGLLHLVNDDREISGAGDSEFFRGACWFVPLVRARAQEATP